jgi:glycosyltransferase involved in cell wall biosynthesis
MNNKKNILVLTYWDYNDALIQTYTLPYVKIISENLKYNERIYLLTLNMSKKKDITFEHPKIKILSFSYIPFGVTAFFYYSWMLFFLWYFILVKKISHIHAWCTPAGLFGYILSVLTGRKLIIDSYEPHAEAMVEVGEWKKNSLPHKILFWFEKKMTHKAEYLIATTDGMIGEYAPSRFGFNPEKKNWFVKPACVDLELFKPDENKRKQLRKMLNLENKIVGIYAGKFGGIYLEDEFFRWLKSAQNFWGDNFVFVLLSSHSKEYVHEKSKKFSLNPRQIIHVFVPHREVVNYLNIADFGITPVKPVYTKKFCSPIKNGEYWAMGLPVIITKDISTDSEIIETENVGYVLKELNDYECLKSIEKINEMLLNNINRDKIIQLASKYRSFQGAKKIYEAIYNE